MTREAWLLISLILAILVVLYLRRRREDHYLKKKILDSVSPRLRQEIEEERRVNKEKKEKFEKALNEAGVKTP